MAVNYGGYHTGFFTDGSSFCISGIKGYKLYDISKGKLLAENVEELIFAPLLFYDTSIYKNKMAYVERDAFTATPAIFDFSTQKRRFIALEPLRKQLEELNNIGEFGLTDFKINMKDEIAVIAYAYFDKTGKQRYGLAPMNFNSEILTNTELTEFPYEVIID